jgi:heat shock protein beta
VALKDKLAAATEETVDEAATATARLLYETALLESGFVPDDAKAFSQRMYSVLKVRGCVVLLQWFVMQLFRSCDSG